MAGVLTPGDYRVSESVLSRTLRCDVLVVATERLRSFRSCGFMERGENTLAVTGLRRCSSSRMPVAWFTLRPLSPSGLVPDGAPTAGFPTLRLLKGGIPEISAAPPA